MLSFSGTILNSIAFARRRQQAIRRTIAGRTGLTLLMQPIFVALPAAKLSFSTRHQHLQFTALLVPIRLFLVDRRLPARYVK